MILSEYSLHFLKSLLEILKSQIPDKESKLYTLPALSKIQWQDVQFHEYYPPRRPAAVVTQPAGSPAAPNPSGPAANQTQQAAAGPSYAQAQATSGGGPTLPVSTAPLNVPAAPGAQRPQPPGSANPPSGAQSSLPASGTLASISNQSAQAGAAPSQTVLPGPARGPQPGVGSGGAAAPAPAPAPAAGGSGSAYGPPSQVPAASQGLLPAAGFQNAASGLQPPGGSSFSGTPAAAPGNAVSNPGLPGSAINGRGGGVPATGPAHGAVANPAAPSIPASFPQTLPVGGNSVNPSGQVPSQTILPGSLPSGPARGPQPGVGSGGAAAPTPAPPPAVGGSGSAYVPPSQVPAASQGLLPAAGPLGGLPAPAAGGSGSAYVPPSQVPAANQSLLPAAGPLGGLPLPSVPAKPAENKGDGTPTANGLRPAPGGASQPGAGAGGNPAIGSSARPGSSIGTAAAVVAGPAAADPPRPAQPRPADARAAYAEPVAKLAAAVDQNFLVMDALLQATRSVGIN